MGSERTREEPRLDVTMRGYALLVCSETGVATFALPEDGVCELGRGEECEIRIEDGSVSRRHARIHAGEPPMLEDSGSRNGTRAHGKPLGDGERVPLPIGTVFELGSVTVVVQRASQSLAAQKPRPPARERPGPGVVVEDPTVRRLYELLDVIAPSTLSVLLLGETGVGKEVFAEELHRRSARARKPFLPLHCAALTESLLETELFGHERGAFTGALQAKAGLFESADGGTVFLDEVGELSPATQAKLLRVLESGEVLRVGSVTPRRVDVRFVAATHRDLPMLVAEESFRSDLYFRLNGITLTIPPLRERLRDIGPLASTLVRRACERAGTPAVALSAEALARLEAHAWPGNVRELRNVIERAVLLARGGDVDAEHVLLDADPRRRSEAGMAGRPLRHQMEAFERDRIREALERAGGHQGKAAELLKISRRTLIDKLELYGIERPRKR